MSDDQRVVISAYKAQIYDERIQNKILSSKIKQKDKHIKILSKALRAYQSYCQNLSREICGRENEDVSTKLMKEEIDEDIRNEAIGEKHVLEVHVQDEEYLPVPHELVPKQLQSNLNPLTKYPRYKKEIRKIHCKKEKN